MEYVQSYIATLFNGVNSTGKYTATLSLRTTPDQYAPNPYQHIYVKNTNPKFNMIAIASSLMLLLQSNTKPMSLPVPREYHN
jgi:hypothetical protein